MSSSVFCQPPIAEQADEPERVGLSEFRNQLQVHPNLSPGYPGRSAASDVTGLYMAHLRLLWFLVPGMALTSCDGCARQSETQAPKASAKLVSPSNETLKRSMSKNHYLIDLSGSPTTDFCKRPFAQQGHEQKVFSAIWELESLVNNGGFQGYFGNGAESASFAPTALRAIEAHRCAAIVEEALALVPASLPNEHEARWDAMHSLPELVTAQFEALDARFFAYPDDLTELLFAFVASHPEVFGPTPSIK